MKQYAIAIDGPAGSGKSTAAKRIAEKLGIFYVDTGAMYRAVGLYCSEHGIDTTDETAVEKVLDNIHLEIGQEEGKQVLYLNGENVTQKVRTGEAGKRASEVAVILAVRKRLVEIQRKLAEGSSIIMDGRDIGTNVLPKAEFKFFLQASQEERIRRRCHELELLNQTVDYEEICRQVQLRDERDSNRKHNPLRKAEDAVEVDTSRMTLDEVVAYLLDMIQQRIKE